MGWNLLAYAVPIGTFVLSHPKVYQNLADTELCKAPLSDSHDLVKEIAKRVLTAENQPEAPYYDRVQQLLQQSAALPKARTGTLLPTRFIAHRVEDALFPIYSKGTDERYYILISSRLPKGYPKESFRRAQEWFATREIFHFLNKTPIKTLRWQAVASLIATFISTFFLGWGFLASLTVAATTSLITRLLVLRRAEAKADDFANHHCSLEETSKASIFFQEMQIFTKKLHWTARLCRSLFYPSDASRVRKLELSRVPSILREGYLE